VGARGRGHLHLVGEALGRGQVTTSAGRQRRDQPAPCWSAHLNFAASEGLHPTEHGPLRDVNAPPGEEHQHAGGGERVAQVPPDRHEDHVRQPVVARECGGRGRHKRVATGAAPVPLTTGAVMAHGAWRPVDGSGGTAA
jgi:hypothetical protein